ncbi:MAG: FixH family protein [Fuerstiella sp.]
MQTAGTVATPTVATPKNTTQKNTGADQRSETVSRFLWCGVVMGLLGLQMTGCLFALFIATTSSSMAVIPNYHRKAMEWDDYKAEQQATADLGWNESIDVSPPIDIMENRLITIRVEDTHKKPIEIEQMTTMVYHHAQAAELHEVTMKRLAPGTFRGKLRIRKAGIWQVESKITTADRTVNLSTKHVVKDEKLPALNLQQPGSLSSNHNSRP